tara:strand:+ start:256179 stop:256841 length:663 start_codon:yes stop_codon:yes gene_type:complete
MNTYSAQRETSRVTTTQRILHRCAVFLLLALPLGHLNALPDDREQPIHISADKALRDEKEGVTVYSGSVQMNQGSMHIEADTLTIYHDADQADKIVAEGNPAKLRQRPDAEKGPVYARANVIEYYQLEEKVHFKDNARIEQDGAMVAGDSIDYFIAEQLVKADSNQTREGNRVQVVLPPTVRQDSPATTATADKAVDVVADTAQPGTTETGNASGATDSE